MLAEGFDILWLSAFGGSNPFLRTSYFGCKMKSSDWQENFKEGKELVLATCSKDSKPNANIVMSNGIVDGKLLVADCQMTTTIKNLEQNPKICVIGGYFRIHGKADIVGSGKYFDNCVKIVALQDKALKVKNAILINVEEVFDLEKVKKIV